jgi:hypothetical protein
MLVRGGVLPKVLICVCLLLTFDNLPFMLTMRVCTFCCSPPAKPRLELHMQVVSDLLRQPVNRGEGFTAPPPMIFLT